MVVQGNQHTEVNGTYSDVLVIKCYILKPKLDIIYRLDTFK